MKCPVCGETVSASSDFVDAEGANDIEASLRILRVPVLFRMDPKDGDRDADQLFGHPHLIKVASRIPGSVLHKTIRKLVPYHSEFSIALVDGQVRLLDILGVFLYIFFFLGISLLEMSLYRTL